jgi:hypothetical protein
VISASSYTARLINEGFRSQISAMGPSDSAKLKSGRLSKREETRKISFPLSTPISRGLGSSQSLKDQVGQFNEFEG